MVLCHEVGRTPITRQTMGMCAQIPTCCNRGTTCYHMLPRHHSIQRHAATVRPVCRKRLHAGPRRTLASLTTTPVPRGAPNFVAEHQVPPTRVWSPGLRTQLRGARGCGDTGLVRPRAIESVSHAVWNSPACLGTHSTSLARHRERGDANGQATLQCSRTGVCGQRQREARCSCGRCVPCC